MDLVKNDLAGFADGEDADGEATFAANSAAVQELVSRVRSTLGPNGNDKIIEKPDGEILVTNDGEVILSNTPVTDPAANIVTGAIRAVDNEVGDGTTSTAILIGALVAQAERLIDEGLHPRSIISGYQRANQLAHRELTEISGSFDGDEADVLRPLVGTAMTGLSHGADRETVLDLLIEAVQRVDPAADDERIQIQTQSGRAVDDSMVFEGAIVNDDPVRQAMPDSVDDADVLVTTDPLELKDFGLDTQINISTAVGYDGFLEQEKQQVREQIDHIEDIGADVILCTESIGDSLQSKLTKAGILAVRQLEDDSEFIAATVDAMIVSNFGKARSEDLGRATVERDESDELFFIAPEEPDRMTILLRAPTEQAVEELHHQAETTLDLLRSTVRDGRIVYGGGASEVALARHLERQTPSVDGREQLAVQAFSEALESIPRLLAESAGLNPIDTLAEISTAHADGDLAAGIDVEAGEITDVAESGLLESAAVKSQILTSSTGAVNRILKIDQRLDVEELSGEDTE